MTEVLPTIGAYDALFTTFQSLICPGDEASCTLSCCSGCLVLSRGNDHLNFYTNLLSFRLVKHFNQNTPEKLVYFHRLHCSTE